MRSSIFNETPEYKKDPEHLVLAEIIKNKIVFGDIKPGQAMWSETFISTEFGVCPSTVKKGLAVLVNEGFIYSIPGKGKYVSDKMTESYELYFDEIKVTDKEYEEIRVIEVNVIKSNGEVSLNLNIPENKLVVMIKRAFINKNQVKIFDVKYIPYYRGVPIVELVTGNTPFPEMVSKKKSNFAMTKKLNIRAKPATGEVKDIFDLSEGDAVLAVEHKYYDEKNNPLGWGTMYFPGDGSGLNAITSFY